MIDRETASVAAYLHIPPVWIHEDPDGAKKLPTDEVYRKTLSCGIRMRVRRDGFFVFDFANWPQAPAFRVLEDPKGVTYIPKEISDSQVKMENYVRTRVTAMNVHLCCLNSSIGTVDGMSLPVRQYITAEDYIALSEFRL